MAKRLGWLSLKERPAMKLLRILIKHTRTRLGLIGSLHRFHTSADELVGLEFEFVDCYILILHSVLGTRHTYESEVLHGLFNYTLMLGNVHRRRFNALQKYAPDGSLWARMRRGFQAMTTELMGKGLDHIQSNL